MVLLAFFLASVYYLVLKSFTISHCVLFVCCIRIGFAFLPFSATEPNSKQLTIFSQLQQELYEIEEKKLAEPQKHIDLSLSIKKRINQDDVVDDGQSNVHKIDVAAQNNGTATKFNQSSQITEVMLGAGDVNLMMPKRVNRAAMKIAAARVSCFLIQESKDAVENFSLLCFRI